MENDALALGGELEDDYMELYHRNMFQLRHSGRRDLQREDIQRELDRKVTQNSLVQNAFKKLDELVAQHDKIMTDLETRNSLLLAESNLELLQFKQQLELRSIIEREDESVAIEEASQHILDDILHTERDLKHRGNQLDKTFTFLLQWLWAVPKKREKIFEMEHVLGTDARAKKDAVKGLKEKISELQRDVVQLKIRAQEDLNKFQLMASRAYAADLQISSEKDTANKYRSEIAQKETKHQADMQEARERWAQAESHHILEVASMGSEMGKYKEMLTTTLQELSNLKTERVRLAAESKKVEVETPKGSPSRRQNVSTKETALVVSATAPATLLSEIERLEHTIATLEKDNRELVATVAQAQSNSQKHQSENTITRSEMERLLRVIAELQRSNVRPETTTVGVATEEARTLEHATVATATEGTGEATVAKRMALNVGTLTEVAGVGSRDNTAQTSPQRHRGDDETDKKKHDRFDIVPDDLLQIIVTRSNLEHNDVTVPHSTSTISPEGNAISPCPPQNMAVESSHTVASVALENLVPPLPSLCAPLQQSAVLITHVATVPAEGGLQPPVALIEISSFALGPDSPHGSQSTDATTPSALSETLPQRQVDNEVSTDMGSRGTLSETDIPNDSGAIGEGPVQALPFEQLAVQALPFKQGPEEALPFKQGPEEALPFEQGPEEALPFKQGPEEALQPTAKTDGWSDQLRKDQEEKEELKQTVKMLMENEAMVIRAGVKGMKTLALTCEELLERCETMSKGQQAAQKKFVAVVGGLLRQWSLVEKVHCDQLVTRDAELSKLQDSTSRQREWINILAVHLGPDNVGSQAGGNGLVSSDGLYSWVEASGIGGQNDPDSLQGQAARHSQEGTIKEHQTVTGREHEVFPDPVSGNDSRKEEATRAKAVWGKLRNVVLGPLESESVAEKAEIQNRLIAFRGTMSVLAHYFSRWIRFVSCAKSPEDFVAKAQSLLEGLRCGDGPEERARSESDSEIVSLKQSVGEETNKFNALASQKMREAMILTRSVAPGIEDRRLTQVIDDCCSLLHQPWRVREEQEWKAKYLSEMRESERWHKKCEEATEEKQETLIRMSLLEKSLQQERETMAKLKKEFELETLVVDALTGVCRAQRVRLSLEHAVLKRFYFESAGECEELRQTNAALGQKTEESIKLRNAMAMATKGAGGTHRHPLILGPAVLIPPVAECSESKQPMPIGRSTINLSAEIGGFSPATRATLGTCVVSERGKAAEIRELSDRVKMLCSNDEEASLLWQQSATTWDNSSALQLHAPHCAPLKEGLVSCLSQTDASFPPLQMDDPGGLAEALIQIPTQKEKRILSNTEMFRRLSVENETLKGTGALLQQLLGRTKLALYDCVAERNNAQADAMRLMDEMASCHALCFTLLEAACVPKLRRRQELLDKLSGMGQAVPTVDFEDRRALRSFQVEISPSVRKELAKMNLVGELGGAIDLQQWGNIISSAAGTIEVGEQTAVTRDLLSVSSKTLVTFARDILMLRRQVTQSEDEIDRLHALLKEISSIFTTHAVSTVPPPQTEDQDARHGAMPLAPASMPPAPKSNLVPTPLVQQETSARVDIHPASAPLPQAPTNNFTHPKAPAAQTDGSQLLQPSLPVAETKASLSGGPGRTDPKSLALRAALNRHLVRGKTEKVKPSCAADEMCEESEKVGQLRREVADLETAMKEECERTSAAEALSDKWRGHCDTLKQSLTKMESGIGAARAERDELKSDLEDKIKTAEIERDHFRQTTHDSRLKLALNYSEMLELKKQCAESEEKLINAKLETRESMSDQLKELAVCLKNSQEVANVAIVIARWAQEKLVDCVQTTADDGRLAHRAHASALSSLIPLSTALRMEPAEMSQVLHKYDRGSEETPITLSDPFKNSVWERGPPVTVQYIDSPRLTKGEKLAEKRGKMGVEKGSQRTATTQSNAHLRTAKSLREVVATEFDDLLENMQKVETLDMRGSGGKHDGGCTDRSVGTLPPIASSSARPVPPALQRMAKPPPLPLALVRRLANGRFNTAR